MYSRYLKNQFMLYLNDQQLEYAAAEAHKLEILAKLAQQVRFLLRFLAVVCYYHTSY